MCSSCSTSTLQNFNPVDLVFAQIFYILLFYICFLMTAISLSSPSPGEDDSMAKGIKSFFHVTFGEDKLSLLCPPCAYQVK